MIVVFRLPKTTLAVEDAVSFVGCVRFPRMQYGRQIIVSDWFDDCMDVIGHDAPGMQAVALAIKVLKCIADHVCDSGIVQCATAGS
ncbi:MAG: hypothetical protein HC901_03460 [Bdellovibrionaceae bacterium]|nr:hypothetical protein [Pseudobdellovibrionaceae bacterium]